MRRSFIANLALIIVLVVANVTGAFAIDRTPGAGHPSKGLHLNPVRVSASHVSARSKGLQERWTDGTACCQGLVALQPPLFASSSLHLGPASTPRQRMIAPWACRPPPAQHA